MKISFLTLAGTENSTTRRMLYLARYLKSKGHEISFFTLNWIAKKGSSGKGSINFEGIGVKEIKLGIGALSMLLTGPLKMMSRLKGDAIVLSKPLPPHTIPFLLANKLMRKRFVLDTDDWEGVGGGASYSHFSWPKRTLITLLEEYVMKKANGISAASRVLEKRARDSGAKKAVYIPNGCNPDDFNATEEEKQDLRKELGIKNERVFISSCSHDSDMLAEGLKLFLEGFGKAKKDFRLIITGQGKHTAEFKSLCNKLRIDDKVIFTGFLPESKFKACVSIADAAITPHIAKYPYTLYAMSSSPRKIYEAMAAGLPVLGCNVGEVGETLADTGLLVPEDAGLIGKKIDEIIEMDDKELKKIGAKNLKKIEEFYNINVQGKKFEEFLKEIVSHQA